MYLDLQLPNIQSMSKDTIIHSILDVMLCVNYDTVRGVLVLIDEE